jgi:small conductance mechanosensitive channel
MEETTETSARVLEWLALHGVDWGVRLLSAVAIFIVGRWLAGLVVRLLAKAMERSHVEASLAKFLSRIAHVLLIIVVILATVDKLGVNTTSFVAIVGAAGLAVGLAMQSSLSNFAAGVMIILFRPFSVGNFIDAGGVKGIVEEISIFNTHLRTPDNLGVIVPNSQIYSSAITNFSAKDRRRVDITFGVSYDDDLKLAKETIWQVLNADERILKDPAPIVGVMNLGESSVDIVCWAWVNSPDFLQVKFHLNETVKTELEKAGCSIPYPQRDVHLFSADQQPA